MLNAHNEVLGAGAQEFLRGYFEWGMSVEEIQAVLSEVEAVAASDKRVKKCEYCGGYWRDDSLRNTKKTCSDECKTGIKTLQRRKQRERKELINPMAPKPKKRTLSDDYVYWLEYPYWTDEYSMLKHGWKHEVPKPTETLDFIEQHKGTWGDGNRKVKAAPGAE